MAESESIRLDSFTDPVIFQSKLFARVSRTMEASRPACIHRLDFNTSEQFNTCVDRLFPHSTRRFLVHPSTLCEQNMERCDGFYETLVGLTKTVNDNALGIELNHMLEQRKLEKPPTTDPTIVSTTSDYDMTEELSAAAGSLPSPSLLAGRYNLTEQRQMEANFWFKHLSGNGPRSLNYPPYINDGVMTLEGTSRALEFLSLNKFYQACSPSVLSSWQELTATPIEESSRGRREQEEDGDAERFFSPTAPTSSSVPRRKQQIINIELNARLATTDGDGGAEKACGELMEQLGRQRMCSTMIRVVEKGLLVLSPLRPAK